MESFKLKLAAYFSLISLLPLAAAFWGFDALTERAEADRAASVLQVGLRSALATYGDELVGLEDTAKEIAHDRDFQRALAAHDDDAVRRALRGSPNLRVEGAGLQVHERAASLAAERPVDVKRDGRRLGRIVASLPVDGRLTDDLEDHSGLGEEHRLLFIAGDHVVAGDREVTGSVEIASGRALTGSLGDKRYRILASKPLPAPAGTRLAIVTPQAINITAPDRPAHRARGVRQAAGPASGERMGLPESSATRQRLPHCARVRGADRVGDRRRSGPGPAVSPSLDAAKSLRFGTRRQRNPGWQTVRACS